MKFTKQQQNCLDLLLIGDRLSYFNGLQYINNDQKYKHYMISTYFKKLNSIKLKKWINSYNNNRFFKITYNIFFKYKFKNKSQLIKTYKTNLYKKEKKTTSIKYRDLNYSILSDKKLLNNNITDFGHSPDNFIKLFINHKKINEPSDENLQIGVIIGILYSNRQYDKDREIVSIALATVTHTHPYSYLSVLTLANIISYIIINKYNFLKGLLESNNYLQQKYR